MNLNLRFLSLPCLTFFALACSPDTTPPPSATSESGSETADPGDGDGDSETSQGDGDGEGDGDGDGGASAIDCEALDLDVKPFDASATDYGFDELVPDFELETLRGSFSLSAAWTGCENMVLIPYSPAYASQSIEGLVDDSDPNTLYMIYSMAADADTARGQVISIASKVEAYLESLGPDAVAQWSERFRYVVQSGQDIPLFTYIHSMNTAADFFAIDQFQHLRNGGSGATVGGDGVWTEQIGHARYAAKFHNYEAHLGQRFAREQAELGDALELVTVIDASWEAETSTNAEGLDGVVTVSFPSAEDMARYDHAELVVKEDCGHFPGDAPNCSGEKGIIVSLCGGYENCEFGEDDLALGNEAFFKVVSGYATGGWWTRDVTQIIPALRAGGDVPMRVTWVGSSDGDLQANIQLRLYDLDDDTSEDPRATVHLRSLGSSPFNAAYAERLPHYQFTPPPGTTKVVLNTHATGHGGGGNGTCAEFCTLGQHFDINEAGYDFQWQQKSNWDCAARVDQGVTPNQWGTWYFDRSNWCPGWTAETYEMDITEAVDLDGPNLLRWSGSTGGDIWPEKGSLYNKVWLTFYGPEDTGPAGLEVVPRETCSNVEAVVRDFSQDFPDFQPVIEAFEALPNDDPEREAANGTLTGVVEATLVEGQAPVFIWPENTLPFTGAATFAQWFEDTPGVNEVVPGGARVHRTREGTAMVMVYPSDGHTPPAVPSDFGSGVEGDAEVNVGYTLEAHATFVYQEGQRIRLGSEDDMWIFIDHQLVSERGGPFHGTGHAVLELDELGLTPGQEYTFDAFLADRGRSGSVPHHWFEIPDCEP